MSNGVKIFLTILISFAIALSAVSVSAQTTTRDQIRDVRQNAREEISQTRQSVREQFKRQREEAVNTIQKKRSELKSAIEVKRAELSSAIQAKRQELKTQLQKIRDERKKQVVERIDAQIDALNKRMTDHYVSRLKQIEDVLDRVISRTDKAAVNGVDVAVVRAAIAKAQAAIAAGRTAAVNQAGKTYSIVISGENTLRNDVGKARQVLRDDLALARDAVKAAHMAVRDAAVSLAKIPRVNELEISGNGQSATSSPATTTQSQ